MLLSKQQKGSNNQYMGRPKPVDVSLMEKIIDSLIEFQSVRKSLKHHGVQLKDFFHTLHENPALENQYMRAQAATAELMAEEIIEIADTAHDAAKARNQIDTRKWYASKTKPQKFGERIDLNINQVVDIGSALAEAQKRAQLPISPLTQAIDVTPQNNETDRGYKPVDAAETKDATELNIDELLK